MEIRAYLTIISRRWWAILLVTLAAASASVYVSQMMPPSYTAETDLRVITPLGGSLGDISYQTYYADRLLNTYAQIAASDQVISDVKSTLGLKTLPEISIKTVPNSEIIEISVSGRSADLVAKVANLLAETIIDKSRENARSEGITPQNLSILTARQVTLEGELSQAKQDRESLVAAYARTSAEMNTLDRNIRMKEAEYQILIDQYQQAVIEEAAAALDSTTVPARIPKNVVSDQMASLDAELSTMRMQYQDLSTNSSMYAQQITSIGQTIQSKEGAYENLLSQIDSAKIANAKQESAQEVIIASPAVPPMMPTGPGRIMIIGLGTLCGLIGGILVAFLLNTLDTRILTLEQVQNMTKLPVIGRLPVLNQKDRGMPWESKDINVQRACGNLSTKIIALQKTRPVKTILVTSPNPAEGKSTIITALARGLAKANRRVLVVDTDLRKPVLPTLFSVSGEHGLIDYLRGENKLGDSIQILSHPCIHFLPGGFEFVDPATLFHTKLFADMLAKIATYDVVLFDSPALLNVPDAYDLALLVDGIILVVQYKRTTIEDIQAIMEQLEDVQEKLVGVVVNQVPKKPISRYYDRKPAKLPRISVWLPGVSKAWHFFKQAELWRTRNKRKEAP